MQDAIHRAEDMGAGGGDGGEQEVSLAVAALAHPTRVDIDGDGVEILIEVAAFQGIRIRSGDWRVSRSGEGLEFHGEVHGL